MGVSFVALISHHGDPAELVNFTRDVQSGKFSFFGPDADKLTWQGGRKDLDIELELPKAWDMGEATSCEIPRSFTFHFHKRVCEVWHRTTWEAFVRDLQLSGGFLTKRQLRALSNQLCLLLGSKLAIYVPDSAHAPSAASDLLHDGANLTVIESWLKEHCGSPTPFAGACQQDNWDKIYYVDDFGEL